MQVEKKELTVLDFLRCRTELNKIGFSDKEILKSLSDLEITKRDLTDEKAFENGTPYCNTYEFSRKGVGHFKQYKGNFVREYTKNADFYFIPAQYQGLKHGKIIEKLLSNRFDWFNSFMKDKSYKESETGEFFDSIGRLNVNSLSEHYKNMTVQQLLDLNREKNLTKKVSAWDLYEMHEAKNYEIYLTTSKGSLYVPITSIMNGDFSEIEKRMLSYANSYHDPKKLSGYALNHRGRTKEEYKKDKEADFLKMIEPLKSVEAIQLKEFLKK